MYQIIIKRDRWQIYKENVFVKSNQNVGSAAPIHADKRLSLERWRVIFSRFSSGNV